jgi:hypothetical protein
MNMPLTKLPCQTDSCRGETEERMIAILSKMSVVGYTFLPAMGRILA